MTPGGNIGKRVGRLPYLMRNESADMKSNENNSHQLLREFIEAVLEEEGQNDLYNTFIQPFVDVGVTAAAGVEKLSAQVQTIVKGFLLGLPTLFVPFLEYDYEAFREEEKAKVEAIKKKYEKTLQANLDAITSNDAFGVAFLLAPSTILAGQLAVKAPEAALKAIDTLTAGLLGKDGILGGIRNALSGPANVGFHDPGGHPSGAWSGSGGGYGDVGDIHEAKDPKDVQKLLKDKKVQAAIQKSPIAKQMRQDGVKIIVDHIKRFMALQDYDQMRKMAKGDVGFSQIGQKLAQMNQSGQLPPQDNPVVTGAMVPELKKAYKDFWIKQLQQLATQYPEANNELLDGIKQIQALQ
jgi:hypothetical protein